MLRGWGWECLLIPLQLFTQWCLVTIHCPLNKRLGFPAFIWQNRTFDFHEKKTFYENRTFGFFFQPSSVHGLTLAFLLDVHRLCDTIEWRLSRFLPHWLEMGWQSVISQGKSLEIFHHDWELNPGHGEDRHWVKVTHVKQKFLNQRSKQIE